MCHTRINAHASETPFIWIPSTPNAGERISQKSRFLIYSVSLPFKPFSLKGVGKKVLYIQFVPVILLGANPRIHPSPPPRYASGFSNAVIKFESVEEFNTRCFPAACMMDTSFLEHRRKNRLLVIFGVFRSKKNDGFLFKNAFWCWNDAVNNLVIIGCFLLLFCHEFKKQPRDDNFLDNEI